MPVKQWRAGKTLCVKHNSRQLITTTHAYHWTCRDSLYCEQWVTLGPELTMQTHQQEAVQCLYTWITQECKTRCVVTDHTHPEVKPAVSTTYENTHLHIGMKKGRWIDRSRVKTGGVSRHQILADFFLLLSLKLRNVPTETKQRRKQTSNKFPQCLRC